MRLRILHNIVYTVRSIDIWTLTKFLFILTVYHSLLESFKLINPNQVNGVGISNIQAMPQIFSWIVWVLSKILGFD